MPLAPGLKLPNEPLEDEELDGEPEEGPLETTQITMPAAQVPLDPRAQNRALLRDYFARQGKLASVDATPLQVTGDDIAKANDQKAKNTLIGGIFSDLSRAGSFGGKVAQNSMPDYYAAQNEAIDQGLKQQQGLYNQALVSQGQGVKALEGLEDLNQREVSQAQQADKFAQVQQVNALKALEAEQKLAGAKRLNDPQSAESQQARFLANQYFPKSNKQFENMSASQIQPYLDEYQKLFAVKSRNEELALRRADQAENAKARQQELALRRQAQEDNRQNLYAFRQEARNDKDFVKLAEKLNGDIASGRSQVGRNTAMINQAEKIQAMIDKGREKGGLIDTQVYELAKALDNMLSTGGTTVSGTEHLIPKTARGDFSKFKQWLTGTPTSMGQDKFVDMMEELINREKNIAIEQRKKALQGITSGYGHLVKSDPERYLGILKQYDLLDKSPEELNALKQNITIDDLKPDAKVPKAEHNVGALSPRRIISRIEDL